MSDRDDLAALIIPSLDVHWYDLGEAVCHCGEEFGGPAHEAEQIVDLILARWRLVPVEEAPSDELAPRHFLPPEPAFDPTNPAMVSAVMEYFEHGFNDETIIAASFPGLTPEILAALRALHLEA